MAGSEETSPYKFYQFWINTADADVYRFLKFFTFMDIAEINARRRRQNSGKAPRAQYVLAEQVTRLVHGEGRKRRSALPKACSTVT